jgi:hypothetical protein
VCIKKQHRLLKRLKKHLDKFVNKMILQHSDDTRVIRMYDRYKQTKLIESNDHETYTLNKGEQIVMCIRNYAKDKKIHDEFNLLVFVSLHELAHIMSIDIGHEREFWKNFKFILTEAAKWEFYIPEDYSLDPAQYCKMIVHDNPYYNERTREDFGDDLRDLLK